MSKATTLSIIGGVRKDGRLENVKEVTIKSGEIVGIVGPTGSGKSTLISDIEQMARGDTQSRRIVLLDGREVSEEVRSDPRKKQVAQLSQNMHFLADMLVGDFLKMHAKSRGRRTEIVSEVMMIANQLCGEPIEEGHHLTSLSGGQSRALMAADIAVISDSPLVLIDEIENAGIKKQEALRLLSGEGKIVVVVTHDPVLALLTARRIVMKNGGMSSVIQRTDHEEKLCSRLAELDNWILGLRETIRNGELVYDS